MHTELRTSWKMVLGAPALMLAFLVGIAQAQQSDRADQSQQNNQQTQQQQQAAQDDAQQAGQDARQELRDTREEGRETRQEARQTTRDERREARQEGAAQRAERFYRGRMPAEFGAQFDDGRADRLVIVDVDRDSVAARTGLRRGDVVVSVNGRGVRSGEDFNRWLGAVPGRGVAIVIQRDGRRFALTTQPWRRDPNRSFSYYGAAPRGHLGVTFDPNYRELAVIREVHRDTPAEKIGLQPGDTLTHIDGQEVRSMRHAMQLITSMDPGREFELEFDRPQHQTTRVTLTEREGSVVR